MEDITSSEEARPAPKTIPRVPVPSTLLMSSERASPKQIKEKKTEKRRMRVLSFHEAKAPHVNGANFISFRHRNAFWPLVLWCFLLLCDVCFSHKHSRLTEQQRGLGLNPWILRGRPLSSWSKLSQCS